MSELKLRPPKKPRRRQSSLRDLVVDFTLPPGTPATSVCDGQPPWRAKYNRSRRYFQTAKAVGLKAPALHLNLKQNRQARGVPGLKPTKNLPLIAGLRPRAFAGLGAIKRRSHLLPQAAERSGSGAAAR